MSQFNFKDIQETTAKPRFTPGIFDGVIVRSVKDGLTANGKKVITVSLLGTKGEEFEANWSMEGAAPQYTMRKLKHMLTKVMPNEEEVNAITTTEQANKALQGKAFRFKFIGTEYVNRDNQVRVKTDIGLPSFCESMKVPANATSLSFDPNNAYDMVRLPADQVPSAKSEAKSDLPF